MQTGNATLIFFIISHDLHLFTTLLGSWSQSQSLEYTLEGPLAPTVLLYFYLHKASQMKIESHLANILCQKKMGLGFVSVLKLLVFLVLRLQIQLSVAFADGPLYPSLVIWGQGSKSNQWCVYKFNPGIVGVWVSVIQGSFIFISKYFSAAINSGRCWEQLYKNVMLVFHALVMVSWGGCEAAVHTRLSCLCVTVCHTLKKKQKT